MRAGQIVLIDWRDAMPGSGEPNKFRPAVVLGNASVYGGRLPFELVAPMTGDRRLAIDTVSIVVHPTPQNRCKKVSYVLAWCVQAVSRTRITETSARITGAQLTELRQQVAFCVAC